MKLASLIVATSLVAGNVLQAAFTLLEDFESYTTGNVSGGSNAFSPNGGPWVTWTGVASNGSTGLVGITDQGGNQYMDYGWSTTNAVPGRGAYHPVTPITDAGSGSYYFQIRSADATPNVSYGLMDVSTPTGVFADFEVQISLVDDGNGGNGLFKLVGQDGSNTIDLVTGLSANTWYDIWLVIDNTTDTFDVYQGTTGDAETLGTLVGDDLDFKNGTTDDLDTFATLTDNHGNRQAHLDNLSFEAIPEPSSSILIALTGFALMGRRRG